jgi:hypothetical protein
VFVYSGSFRFGAARSGCCTCRSSLPGGRLMIQSSGCGNISAPSSRVTRCFYVLSEVHLSVDSGAHGPETFPHYLLDSALSHMCTEKKVGKKVGKRWGSVGKRWGKKSCTIRPRTMNRHEKGCHQVCQHRRIQDTDFRRDWGSITATFKTLPLGADLPYGLSGAGSRRGGTKCR